ncbi:hypothetical protein [uncultured Arcticibacterium sp.]|uniref:hypothetical protein n=1 Tax=uncultured Arcticibacterium sp. TaxID=2173042 RepID=UPI0030F50C2C
MKTLLSITVFILSTSNLLAQVKKENISSKKEAISRQDNSLKKLAKQATIMSNAFVQKDYDTFLNFLHPKILQSLGERRTIIQNLNEGFESGDKVLEIFNEQPSELIIGNKTYQCTFTQRLKMLINQKGISINSTLIAISYNKGKDWKFVNTSGSNIEDLRDLIPELSMLLVF